VVASEVEAAEHQLRAWAARSGHDPEDRAVARMFTLWVTTAQRTAVQLGVQLGAERYWRLIHIYRAEFLALGVVDRDVLP